jgi:hypothetical protein
LGHLNSLPITKTEGLKQAVYQVTEMKKEGPKVKQEAEERYSSDSSECFPTRAEPNKKSKKIRPQN